MGRLFYFKWHLIFSSLVHWAVVLTLTTSSIMISNDNLNLGVKAILKSIIYFKSSMEYLYCTNFNFKWCLVNWNNELSSKIYLIESLFLSTLVCLIRILIYSVSRYAYDMRGSIASVDNICEQYRSGFSLWFLWARTVATVLHQTITFSLDESHWNREINLLVLHVKFEQILI